MCLIIILTVNYDYYFIIMTSGGFEVNPHCCFPWPLDNGSVISLTPTGQKVSAV